MKSGLVGSEPLSPAARRALIAGCIGFAVDFFDMAPSGLRRFCC
jgi:hypothetical protein